MYIGVAAVGGTNCGVVGGGRLTAGDGRLRAGHARYGWWKGERVPAGNGQAEGQDLPRCRRLEGGYGSMRAGHARLRGEIDRALLIKSYSHPIFTQALHVSLDVTKLMVYTISIRAVLSYYILCQFSIRYLIS